MTSINENLMGSFVAFFDHGLLVIEDSESSAAHEGWDAVSEHVHFDADSLYVGVRSVVDGPVSVFVYRTFAPSADIDEMVEIFSGEFESKFSRILIHDSDDMADLVVRATRGIVILTVFVDSVEWSERVVVVIDPRS